MTILLIFLTLLCSAIFSGMEIAFISTSKLEVELARQKRGWIGRRIQQYKDNTPRFIGTILLGNNIALVLFGLLITNLLEPILAKSGLPAAIATGFTAYLIITLFSTILILFAGEFIPKNIFRINPIKKLSFFAAPFYLVYWLLYPFVWFILVVSRLFLGEEQEKQQSGLSSIDLEHYIDRKAEESEGEQEAASKMMSKALDLPDIKARECMVPRNEITAVEKSTEFQELKKVFVESRHSKILVYEESIDHPVGYFHHLDILKDRKRIYDLKLYPETVPARKILQYFIQNNKSIALVVDEYGGTAGLVTLEDIIEEIFGEIEDEHDAQELIIKQISETEFEFSGRVEVDYINEHYGLKIPEGEYETIAGFIVENNEDIPQTGDNIQIPPFNCQILEASNRRIERIRIIVEKE